MTEGEVTHIQMPKDFKKAEAVGWLTALAGMKTGKPYMTGAGLITTAKSALTSQFGSVKSIKVSRNRNTVYLISMPERNQVYAEDADFDFVAGFITGRCPGARIK